MLRPRRLLIGASAGGAVTGVLALPRFQAWQAAIAGVLLGVLVWATIMFYRRFVSQLGTFTIWAAIACMWAAVFGVVGWFSSDCATISCSFGAAAGNAGAGAITALAIAILLLPWRTGRSLLRWRRNRRQARRVQGRNQGRAGRQHAGNAAGNRKHSPPKKKAAPGRQ